MRKLISQSLVILILLFGIIIGSAYNAHGGNNEPTVLWKINNCGPSLAIDDENNIYTLNHTSLIKITPDGHIVWNVTIYPLPYSGPLVSGDIIYVASYVQLPPLGGSSPRYLYAISADGQIKWKLEFQPSGWGGFSQMAVNKYGEIFLNSNDGYTYAVYPNGSLKWKLNTNASFSSAPAVYNNTLYVAIMGLYAMDFNGTIKWTLKYEERAFITPVVGNDGTIYVAFDKLYAISPNGVVKWKAGIRGYIPPTLDYNKGRIYTTVMYPETILYALSIKNGHTIWKTEIGGDEASIPAVDKNGYIYLTNFYGRNNTGYLFCISPDGKIIWRFKLDGGGTLRPPVIGKDGTIYVGTGKGVLYAIEGYVNENQTNENNLWLYYTVGIGIGVAAIAAVVGVYVWKWKKKQK